MIVRVATTADQTGVRGLAEGFGLVGHSDQDGRFAHQFRRIVDDEDWLLAVAEDAAELRGYALAQDHGPGLRSAFTTGRLRDLYVDPEVRRRGVARALMAAVVGWAHARPMPMILDWQAPASSVGFYCRLGFRADHVGDFPEYPGFSLDTRGGRPGVPPDA